MEKPAEFFLHLYTVRGKSEMSKHRLPAHIKEIVHRQFPEFNPTPDFIIFFFKYHKHFRTVLKSCFFKAQIHRPCSTCIEIQKCIVNIQKEDFYLMIHVNSPLVFVIPHHFPV